MLANGARNVSNFLEGDDLFGIMTLVSAIQSSMSANARLLAPSIERVTADMGDISDLTKEKN